MILTRTDPLSAVDRIFEQVFGSPVSSSGSIMAMDAVWRGDELVLTIDVPGVAEESIDVTVSDRVLTVTAERPEPAEKEGERWALRERSHGRGRAASDWVPRWTRRRSPPLSPTAC